MALFYNPFYWSAPLVLCFCRLAAPQVGSNYNSNYQSPAGDPYSHASNQYNAFGMARSYGDNQNSFNQNNVDNRFNDANSGIRNQYNPSGQTYNPAGSNQMSSGYNNLGNAGGPPYNSNPSVSDYNQGNQRNPPVSPAYNQNNQAGIGPAYNANPVGDGRPFYRNPSGDGGRTPYNANNPVDGGRPFNNVNNQPIDSGRPFNNANNPPIDSRPPPYNVNNVPLDGGRPPYGNAEFQGDAGYPNAAGDYIPQQQLEAFLQQVDALASQQCSANVQAQWEYETNINDATQLQALRAQQGFAGFQREVWEALKQIDLSRVADPRLVRQIRYLSVVGSSALPPDQYDRYNRLISEMIAVYEHASICAYNEPFRCGLRLNPDLTVIMGRSRDWDELQHTWLEWRRHTGQYIRDLYDQLAQLTNQAARLNNFTDGADMWTFPYESAAFPAQVEEVWAQVSPVFEQLHAYVRRKLRDLYGPERVSKTAPLPSHILGNMWAQSWSNIMDITIPYPGKNLLDTTPNMQAQGYTPVTMLQLAEEFYLSMNMTALPPEFWASSVIANLGARPINCQASAWDFCNGRDYRLKMCAGVNMKDLSTMHHELAHIQYFLQYRNLPKVFRDGANPGFHEAVGEAIALSASSPTHLQTLGLIQTSVTDLPIDINYLFSIAMDKLPFLAFALATDSWRWDVFRKQVNKEQFNCHWHSLRERYLGVKPPILRSEIDFDPGSKYHIPANIPYIRYFVGTILQFQIHRHLCTVAGQFDPNDLSKPLHRCDIYRSKEAGQVLKDIMQSGSSVPWQEVLHRTTGQRSLDGTAVRDFFKPLEDWLRNENLRTQEYPGWIYDGDYCKFSIETAGLFVRGGYYNSAPTLLPTTVYHLFSVLSFIVVCLLVL